MNLADIELLLLVLAIGIIAVLDILILFKERGDKDEDEQ